MDKRSYNIFFHLHTVTGIVICVLLYIIFFAGSFSFFRNEIIAWERSEPVTAHSGIGIDIERALDTLEARFDLRNKEILFHKHAPEKRVAVFISFPHDTVVSEEENDFVYLHPQTFQTYEYEKSYPLGEFLYRLHFFAQIPYPAGYYLSGFTSLFFLFAILTGVLVHWKKIVSNFYLFRPWKKLKTVWTDAHTVLGTIGLPFQVMYAITGAFFMINIVLVIPSLALLYDGDQEKFYDDLGFGGPHPPIENIRLTEHTPVNQFVAHVDSTWKNFEITEVTFFNYGDRSMQIRVGGALEHGTKFTGFGNMIFQASTGKIVAETDPYISSSYLDGVKNALYHLHFGDYGGYAVKSISFVLGLISCFVIITGILIWLEARNKNTVPDKERRFNQRVGHIYLAACLTMFPVTALSFILTQLLPAESEEFRMTFLYSTYFGSWLAATVFFAWKKDNYFPIQYTLLTGAIIGCTVPIANGLVTGNWLWTTLRNGYFDIAVVDILWILISAAAFYTVTKLRRPEENGSTESDDEAVADEAAHA